MHIPALVISHTCEGQADKLLSTLWVCCEFAKKNLELVDSILCQSSQSCWSTQEQKAWIAFLGPWLLYIQDQPQWVQCNWSSLWKAMPSASTFTTGSVPGSRTHNLKNQAPLRSSSCPIILIGLKFIQTCARRNLEALSRACLLGKEIAMGSHPLLCLSHHLVLSICQSALLTFSLAVSIFIIFFLPLPMLPALPWVGHAILRSWSGRCQNAAEILWLPAQQTLQTPRVWTAR